MLIHFETKTTHCSAPTSAFLEARASDDSYRGTRLSAAVAGAWPCMLLCLPSPLLLLAWYFSERPGSWPRAHRFTSQDVPRGEQSFHLPSYSMCPASGPSPTASADVHWAQAPRRAITDPLRCQADMEQLLAAAGPEQSPPCVRVTANPPRTNTPQLAQLAVPQRRDLLEQLLHLTMLRAIFTAPSQSPDSSRFSSAIAPLLCHKWQVSCQLAGLDQSV
jgi:hypothetical protein